MKFWKGEGSCSKISERRKKLLEYFGKEEETFRSWKVFTIATTFPPPQSTSESLSCSLCQVHKTTILVLVSSFFVKKVLEVSPLLAFTPSGSFYHFDQY